VGAAVDRVVDLVHRVHSGPGLRVTPRSNLDRLLAIGRPGWRAHESGGGHAGGRRRAAADGRRFAEVDGLGATVHGLGRGLNQDKEENSANLTRGSLTTMGQRSSRTSATGGRDHGLAWRTGF
jgi:hypothetical protein